MGLRWTMRLIMVALLALTSLPVLAGNARQSSVSIEEGGATWSWSVSWNEGPANPDTVSFFLAAGDVAADRSRRRRVQLVDLYAHMAQAAQDTPGLPAGVSIRAQSGPGGVELGGSGPPGALRTGMQRAQDHMAAARADWMERHRVFEPKPGVLSYDHARIAAESAAAVAPLARALREGTASDRAFVARALAFVQAIPYQRGRRGQDTGFQHPLALLSRNKGDCDGKVALFAALVRAELPDVPVAILYVPDHALAAVGLSVPRGEQSITVDGHKMLLVEPVGPGAVPVGEIAPENAKALRRADARLVPVLP